MAGSPSDTLSVLALEILSTGLSVEQDVFFSRGLLG